MSQEGIVNIIQNMPSIPITFTAETGTATPAANNINFFAGSNLTSTGSGSTITYSLTGLQNHSLVVGNGTSGFTNLGVATNGQIPIGSTGADPVLNTITAGSGITITNGAGTITIAATGGSVEVETLTGNTGGAISPTAGNINTVGTGSITIAGSGSTLTTQLTGLTNHSLLVGAGSATITNLGVATNGQLPIGSTGADPVLSTITAGAGITITNGAGSITIAATSGVDLTITTVTHAQSPYTVLAADQFLAVNVTAGVVTILLPNTPTTGRVIYIKDSKGLASTSNISVTTVGGTVTIDGLTTYTMNSNYQATTVIFDGTNYEVF